MPTIVPIPGAVKAAGVTENLAGIKLDESELAEIQQVLDRIPVTGARYGGPLAELTHL